MSHPQTAAGLNFRKALFELAAHQPQSLPYVHSLLSELLRGLPPEADRESITQHLIDAIATVSAVEAISPSSGSLDRVVKPDRSEHQNTLEVPETRTSGEEIPNSQNPRLHSQVPKFSTEASGAISDIRCTSYLFSSELVHEFALGKSRLALRRQDFLSVVFAICAKTLSSTDTDKFTVTEIKDSITSNLNQPFNLNFPSAGQCYVTDVPQTKLYVAIRLLRRFGFLQQSIQNKRFYSPSWPDDWGSNCSSTLMQNVYSFWVQHVNMGEGRLDGLSRKVARNKLRNGVMTGDEYLEGMTDYELSVLVASFEDTCHTVDGPELSMTRSELVNALKAHDTQRSRGFFRFFA